MKISIVTVSYNQAEFLERTIRSVAEQDFRDVEYIVVDPGSTDGSRDIIQRYRSRITEVVLEPDSGSADGLNKGFARASGKILGFLNSDDVLLGGALGRVAAFFTAHPDVDVVSGHAAIIDARDHKLRNCYSERFSLTRYAYGNAIMMQPSTFFRAEVFRRCGGFNPENMVAWDGELYVDMALAGARYAVADEFWSGFRLHPASITSSKKLDEASQAYRRYIFRKIMGRDPTTLDVLPFLWYRLLKHAGNPRALYERIAKGPVYGRYTGAAR